LLDDEEEFIKLYPLIAVENLRKESFKTREMLELLKKVHREEVELV